MSVAKARVKDKFEEFIANDERRRLYERESLAFDATELISLLMEEKQVSKAELARRVRKSRAHITQLLNGSRNMTMHTLADLAFALGSRIEFKSRACPHRQSDKADAQTHYLYRFAGHRTRNPYVPTQTEKVREPVQSHYLGA